VFRAGVFDGLVDHLLEFVRGNVGKSCAGFADGLVEDAPTDRLFDELREVAFFHALGPQEGTQGMICLFRPGNGQTGGLRLGHLILRHINIYTNTATVKSSLNPSLSGQSVTFTATVTSPTTTPTGTVTFNDGSHSLATGTLSGGKASYSTTTLSTGSHVISAIYNGTANIKGSASATLLQNVN
jgi:hypothetical protein